MGDLKGYFYNATACKIGNLDDTNMKRTSLRLMMKSYSIFFPIYDEVTGDVLPAKDLSELDLTLPPDHGINFHIGNLGYLLGHLLSDAGVLTRSHTAAIIEHLFKGIANRLGAPNMSAALRILTYFVANLQRGFLFKRNPEYPLYEGCPDLENGVDICANVSAAQGICQFYCQEMATAAKTSEDVIAEVFNMALNVASPSWETSSRNMLPDCSWKNASDQACWANVVTNHGVCFTNYYHTSSGVS